VDLRVINSPPARSCCCGCPDIEYFSSAFCLFVCCLVGTAKQVLFLYLVVVVCCLFNTGSYFKQLSSLSFFVCLSVVCLVQCLPSNKVSPTALYCLFGMGCYFKQVFSLLFVYCLFGTGFYFKQVFFLLFVYCLFGTGFYSKQAASRWQQ